MAFKTKLAELIVDITAKTAPLKGALARARAMMKRGLASMVRMAKRAALAIGVGLAAGLVWATKKALEQEDAEIKLARALALTGDATKENIDDLKKYASAMQETTLQGDEATLALMAQLKTLGVHTDKLKEGARAFVAFQHMAMRGNTALKAAAALMKGDTSLLRSYSSELRAATSDSEGMRIAMAMVERGFAAEEAAAETTTGTLKQMWNTIGDVAESITTPLLPRIKELAKATKDWAIENQALITAEFGKWLDRTGKALTRLATGAKAVGKHWKALAAVLAVGVFAKIITAAAAVVTALNVLGAAMVATVAAITTGVGFIVWQLNDWLNVLTKLIKARRELGKKQTFDQRAAKAAASADERAIRRKKNLLALEKKRLAAAKKAAEAEVVAVKAAMVVVKTDDEIEAIKKAAFIKLAALRDYYVKVGGHEKELAAVRKALRMQEASDIAKVIGGDSLDILKELEAAVLKKKLEAALAKAKAPTPADVLKVGLASFQSGWNAIATGAKRIDEQQLAVQKKIQEELAAIKEQGQKANGIQSMTVPRF